MEFEIIDYSELYYKGMLAKAVPAVRSGKFVQIRDVEADKEYVVLSPKGLSAYHANIVERFCSQGRRLRGDYNPKKDSFRIRDVSWEVMGGGVWTIDSVNRVLDLSGVSQAYGRFDTNGLKSRVLALSVMKGYTVTIDGM